MGDLYLAPLPPGPFMNRVGARSSHLDAVRSGPLTAGGLSLSFLATSRCDSGARGKVECVAPGFPGTTTANGTSRWRGGGCDFHLSSSEQFPFFSKTCDATRATFWRHRRAVAAACSDVGSADCCNVLSGVGSVALSESRSRGDSSGSLLTNYKTCGAMYDDPIDK